jgi:hypothetical protein
LLRGNFPRMRSLLVALAVVIASALLSLTWAVGPAPAATKRACGGSVTLFSTKLKIVVLQGVTCRTARRVTHGIHNGGSQKTGWSCALAHAPFSKINGRDIAFTCAKGGSGGSLLTWPHAFVGTVAPTPPAGTTPTR